MYVWGEESAPLSSRAAHRHAATTLATYEVEREERRREGRGVKGNEEKWSGVSYMNWREGGRQDGWKKMEDRESSA